MKKTCKTMLSLLLALVMALSLSVSAFAADPTVDIVYKGENALVITPKDGHHTGTDLFGSFKGMMPGDDSKTETITFKNESTSRNSYVKLYIVAVPHGQDNPLVDKEHITDVDAMKAFLANFTMTVEQGGKVIFTGKPDEVGTFGGDGCLLGTFRKGEGTTLTVKLSLDILADNTVAYREGEVDWKFIAEEYPPGGNPTVTPGTLIQTGQLNWPIAVLAAAGAVLIALGWVILRKKRHGNA